MQTKGVWIAVAAVWAFAMGGCAPETRSNAGSAGGERAYVGTYGMQVSAEDSARFDENLREMEAQPGGKEMAAKARKDYDENLAGASLTVNGDGTWVMQTPATVGPGKASGTYVAEGDRLTLRTTKLGDQPTKEGDQPPITFTFDPGAGTLTAHKGDQSLVYKRR